MMSEMRRPRYSEEDLLDINLAKLNYRDLQAIALSMNIPGNIKRIDMDYLVKAVRDGKGDVLHEYNKYREENPHIPWNVTQPTNPDDHQDEHKQVTPVNSRRVQTNRNGIRRHRAPRNESEHQSTPPTQYVGGSLHQRHQVISRMRFFQPDFGWMERNFIQTLWTPLHQNQTPVYVPLELPLPQQPLGQQPYVSMDNMERGTPKMSKEAKPSVSNSNTEANIRDFDTQDIDIGQDVLLIDEDVVLEVDLNVKKKRKRGKSSDTLMNVNRNLKSDSQNEINNDGHVFQYSQSRKQGNSQNQWNSNEQMKIQFNDGVKVNHPHKITCCPCIGCKVMLPSCNLAQHVLKAHAKKVRNSYYVDVRIVLSDLQKRKKLVHFQNVSNRIFLTTIEYLNGLMYVTMQYLPDTSNTQSTAIVRIKMQNDNIRKWEGYVPIYNDLKFQSQNFCLLINLNNYCESQVLKFRTMIFYGKK